MISSPLFFKKFFSLLLCLVFVFSQFTPIYAQSLPGGIDSKPAVPVNDAPSNRKEVGITIFGITVPGITYDSIMITISKRLLEKMSDATVDWINRGFKGGPAYATDPGSFFTAVGRTTVDSLLSDIGNGALCSPFGSKVKIAVERLYIPNASDRNERYQCTLDKVTRNIDSFINGRFSEGGWDAWFEITQTKTSNPYGSFLTLKAEAEAEVAKAEAVEKMKLDWGNGFFSFSGCDVAKGEICPTKTPGTVIASQLEGVLGSEIKQLELADEFDEIVSALVGQLVGRVFNSGEGLITTGSTPWSGGGLGGKQPGNSLGVTCYADNNEALAGEDITWTATTNAQNVTYSWSGDENLSGTTAVVVKKYTTAGTKKAKVTVTSTKMINGQPTTDTVTVDCIPPVQISLYSQLTGACTVDKKWAVLREQVTYTATFTGGSGNGIYWFEWPRTNLEMNEYKDGAPTTGETETKVREIVSGEKIRLPQSVNGFYEVSKTLLWGTGSAGIPHLQGDKQVKLMILDSDRNVEPKTIQCPSVTILISAP